MRRFYLIGFSILLTFDTVAQVCFKLTAEHADPLEASLAWLFRVFTNPWVYISIAGYIGAFFTWMTLLKRAPVGPAFAATHLEVITVMIASIWVFNEQITFLRLLGALAIVAGIIVLALAEKEVMEQEAQQTSREEQPQP